MSCSSYSHRAIDKVKLNDNFCRIRVNLSSINLTSLNFLAKIRASQLKFEVLLIEKLRVRVKTSFCIIIHLAQIPVQKL